MKSITVAYRDFHNEYSLFNHFDVITYRQYKDENQQLLSATIRRMPNRVHTNPYGEVVNDDIIAVGICNFVLIDEDTQTTIGNLDKLASHEIVSINKSSDFYILSIILGD